MDNHLWLYDTENGNELDHIYYRDMSHDLGERRLSKARCGWHEWRWKSWNHHYSKLSRCRHALFSTQLHQQKLGCGWCWRCTGSGVCWRYISWNLYTAWLIWKKTHPIWSLACIRYRERSYCSKPRCRHSKCIRLANGRRSTREWETVLISLNC